MQDEEIWKSRQVSDRSILRIVRLGLGVMQQMQTIEHIKSQANVAGEWAGNRQFLASCQPPFVSILVV
jgi:hypothetical protein